VRAVDGSTLRVDVAEFLTGDEAERAAVAAGAIAEGEDVPNDYFVRNDDESTVAVPVADEVRVLHVQCKGACEEDVEGDFGGFAAAFGDEANRDLTDEYRGAASQYWLEIDSGEVTEIDEQYVP
jgi:hypothetical protein